MKPTIACEHCGAPVLRDEENTLTHQWLYQTNRLRLRRGALVAYACSKASDTSHMWGKVRSMTRPATADEIVRHRQAEAREELGIKAL